MRGLIYSVNYANSLKKKINYDKLILFTDGINELGKYKRKIYKRSINNLGIPIEIYLLNNK